MNTPLFGTNKTKKCGKKDLRFTSADWFRKQCILLFFLLIPFLFPNSFVAAKIQDGDLSGQVINKRTKLPLKDVVVVVLEKNIQTISDEKGNFCISGLPVGDYSVEFSLTGFKTFLLQNIRIFSQDSTRIDVELEEKAPPLSEHVTVFGTPLPSTSQLLVSGANMNSEIVSRIPGSIEDISRVLKIVPGTSHVNELSNDIIVRGGSPWENGVFIDNIQIPNINHFQRQGSSGGLIGIIDTSLIEDLSFYTGGFSVAFGNQMSSILDIRFREGTKDHFKAKLNLNTAGFGGSAEGPVFGKKGSWLLSLSRNYHDVVAKIFGSGVVPRFGAVHFKFSLDINPRNKISLINVYGNSQLSYDLEAAIEEGFHSYLNYNSRLNTLGINWHHSWKQKGYSNTSLSYSFFNTSYTISNVQTDSLAWDFMINDEFYDVIDLRNVNFYEIGKKNQIKFGFDLKYEKTDFFYYLPEHIDVFNELRHEAALKKVLGIAKGGLFFTLVHSPLKHLIASIGVRLDHIPYSGNFHFSPRFSTSYRLSNRIAVHGSLGVYYQTLPLFLLASHESAKMNSDPVAEHAILGMKYDLAPDTYFSVNIYNKQYKNLPVSLDDLALFIMDSGVDFRMFRPFDLLDDSGTAFSRGIELLLQKKTIDNFYGTISASFFRSRFKDVNGIWRNRISDNRYVLSVMGGYKPGEKWGFSGRWILAGGVPYTPFDIVRSEENNLPLINQDQINGKRYSPYMTVSIRVDRRFLFKKSSIDFYLSVLNLFNRKNVDRYFWNRIENRRDVIYQAPIIPLFGIEYNF